ncbi:hypothetical protein BASA81_003403 [Batrachochytrium salamandrivorans]|nr:hypothetical protein BASA81_003403 [Batrachochytrium salamandrivorans]
MVLFSCCGGGEEEAYGDRPSQPAVRENQTRQLGERQRPTHQLPTIPPPRSTIQRPGPPKPRFTVQQQYTALEQQRLAAQQRLATQQHLTANKPLVFAVEDNEETKQEEADLKFILRQDFHRQVDPIVTGNSRHLHVLQTIYEPLAEEKEEDEDDSEHVREIASSGVARSLAKARFVCQLDLATETCSPLKKIPAVDSGLNHQAKFPFYTASSMPIGSWDSLTSFGSSYESDSTWQIGEAFCL